MDWYFTRETDDFVVPDGRETEEISTAKLSGKFTIETAQEFYHDEQTLSTQISDEIPGHRCKRSSNSSACKQTSSTDCGVGMSEASIQSISDFRSPDIIEPTDDTFLNSLLEDDLQNVASPLKFENSGYSFSADVNMDSLSLIMNPARSVSSTCVKPFGFLQSSNYISEDRIKDNSSSPMNRMVNSESDECREQTVLQELEHVMIQLNTETRICFRDALYRLAENSKRAEHQNENHELNYENSRKEKNQMVAKLNAIDEMVANMMFSSSFFNRHNFFTEIRSKESYDHQSSMHHQWNSETHLFDVLASKKSENMDEYFSEIGGIYPNHF